MKEPGLPRKGHDSLLEELEAIRDVYRFDVKQFVAFVREKKLLIVEGFKQYAKWLDEEHEGKRYSPATINRKLAAARSRVRYAFKHSAFADSLQRKYRLEDVLKSVKLKKLDTPHPAPAKMLDVEEARTLIGNTRGKSLRLMMTFLMRTGVRISEMLRLKIGDVTSGRGELVNVRVRGKPGRERLIRVKKDLVKQITEHFNGQTYLFEHDGRMYSRVSVTNRVKQESLRILGRETSPRQLRHSWAAIQIKKGRSVSAVAAALGHTSLGLTAQMYSASAPGLETDHLDLDEVTRKGLTGEHGEDGTPA